MLFHKVEFNSVIFSAFFAYPMFKGRRKQYTTVYKRSLISTTMGHNASEGALRELCHCYSWKNV